MPGRRARSLLRGLTLIELMVVVTIVALLLMVAVPSFTSFIARGRVSGAAEATSQDLQLMKSESLRNNGDVTLSISPGATWCYGAVVASTACTCTTANSCSLRTLSSTDFPGVSMALQTGMGTSSTFSALRGLGQAVGVENSNANAGTLRVRMTASGQVSICRVSGSFSNYAAC